MGMPLGRDLIRKLSQGAAGLVPSFGMAVAFTKATVAACSVGGTVAVVGVMNCLLRVTAAWILPGLPLASLYSASRMQATELTPTRAAVMAALSKSKLANLEAVEASSVNVS